MSRPISRCGFQFGPAGQETTQHQSPCNPSPLRWITPNIDLGKNVRAQYRDEYTNGALPKEWVEEAIEEELAYLCDRVWVGIPLAEALKDPEAKSIGAI